MKVLIAFLFAAAFALAQAANPLCPGATGTAPHCTILTWGPPVTGVPTVYNVYRASATGVCTWTAPASGSATIPAGCTLVGSVAVPALTYTDNSSATNTLTEGATYFYVVSAANSAGESGPSNESPAKIPVTLPSNPQTLSAVPH